MLMYVYIVILTSVLQIHSLIMGLDYLTHSQLLDKSQTLSASVHVLLTVEQ